MSAVGVAETHPTFGHRGMAPGAQPPTGDPLHGAAFETIWDQTLKPDLTRLEETRQRAVMVLVIVLLAAGLLAWSEFLFMPPALARPWRIEGPFLTILLGALLGAAPLTWTVRRAKGDVLAALCAPLGVSYAPRGSAPAASPTFLSLNLLPHPSDSRFLDFLSGQRNSVGFSLCQARLWQGSGKSRTLAFSGQILMLHTGRALRATTAVLRHGFLTSFSCPKGLSPVGLEDPRFSNVFVAFGSDQVEAREILTPAFMQRLLDLEAAYAGEKLRCAFVGPDVLIALQDGDCFKFGSALASFVDRTRAQAIAGDLERIFDLVDSFAGR
ncbi:MAG TPA: DUF3137 domain-containing protein [Caulobacteraceae bacterium]|nr:DUF3137 domain-containing protein [Caulobacteraceae bacterium]